MITLLSEWTSHSTANGINPENDDGILHIPFNTIEVILRLWTGLYHHTVMSWIPPPVRFKPRTITLLKTKIRYQYVYQIWSKSIDLLSRFWMGMKLWCQPRVITLSRNNEISPLTVPNHSFPISLHMQSFKKIHKNKNYTSLRSETIAKTDRWTVRYNIHVISCQSCGSVLKQYNMLSGEILASMLSVNCLRLIPKPNHYN